MTELYGPRGRNRLLAALAPSDFAILDRQLRDIPMEHGGLLQEAGDPIEHVYFPLGGMISLLAVMQTGDAVETATIGREGRSTERRSGNASTLARAVLIAVRMTHDQGFTNR